MPPDLGCQRQECVAKREAERTEPACASTPGGCGTGIGQAALKYRGESASFVEAANALKSSLAAEFPDIKVMQGDVPSKCFQV